MFKGCSKLNFLDLSNWNLSENVDMENMFELEEGKSNKEKILLVLTNDEEIKKYNFKEDNRIGSRIKFNAVDGKFNENDTVRYTKELFVINAYENQDLLTTVENIVNKELNKVDNPNKVDYIFKEWEVIKIKCK
jgi:surface protein